LIVSVAESLLINSQ